MKMPEITSMSSTRGGGGGGGQMKHDWDLNSGGVELMCSGGLVKYSVHG